MIGRREWRKRRIPYRESRCEIAKTFYPKIMTDGGKKMIQMRILNAKKKKNIIYRQIERLLLRLELHRRRLWLCVRAFGDDEPQQPAKSIRAGNRNAQRSQLCGAIRVDAFASPPERKIRRRQGSRLRNAAAAR